jgi:hypothetical protein
MERERIEGIVLHISESTTHYPGQHQFSISLRVGKFTTGKPFVTSPAIRRAIQKAKLSDRRPIGRIEFFVDHASKVITSHDVKPTALLHGRKKELFQRIGLSTRVDLAIEKVFRKRFPEYALRSTSSPSETRSMQLKKRGRIVGKPIPLTAANELTRRAAIQQFRAHINDVKHAREREKRRARFLTAIRRRAI